MLVVTFIIWIFNLFSVLTCILAKRTFGGRLAAIVYTSLFITLFALGFLIVRTLNQTITESLVIAVGILGVLFSWLIDRQYVRPIKKDGNTSNV